MKPGQRHSSALLELSEYSSDQSDEPDDDGARGRPKPLLYLQILVRLCLRTDVGVVETYQKSISPYSSRAYHGRGILLYCG